MIEHDMSTAQALQIVTEMLTGLAVSVDRPFRTLQPSERLPLEEIVANRFHLGRTAKVLINARKHRKTFAFSFMLSDPAWDILLELFLNWSEGKPMRFKDVTLSTGLSAGTAQRYLQTMAENDLLTRTRHATDARVTFFDITKKGLIEVGTYMSSAGAIAPSLFMPRT